MEPLHAPVDMKPIAEDLEVVRSASADGPSVALVLGSGLDPVAEALEDRVDVSYLDLRGMSVAGRVAGQAGTLTLGRSGETPVVCFRGTAPLLPGRLGVRGGVSRLDLPRRLGADDLRGHQRGRAR